MSGWAQLIGAVIGGVAGGEKDTVTSSNKSGSGVSLRPESELEKYGGQLTDSSLRSLEGMVNAGPGQSAITDANSQYGSLAEMLSGFAKTGGAPGQQDWLQAQEFAKSQFAPQQLQIDQSFEEEQMRAKQLATQLGRPVNDPYIQAQLSKQKMNMQNMMGAQQGAFIGQEARNNAMGRLGYTSQLADLRGSLASQAMANRQALLSLGSGVQAQERNWRFQTSDKWGLSHTTQESGGGFKGAMSGAMAGASAASGMGGGKEPSTKPTTNATTTVMPTGSVEAMGSGQAVMVQPSWGQMPSQQAAMPQRGSRFSQPASSYSGPMSPGYQIPQPYNLWGPTR